MVASSMDKRFARQGFGDGAEPTRGDFWMLNQSCC